MATKRDKNALQVTSTKDVSEEKVMADIATDSPTNNGMLVKHFSNVGELDLTECMLSMKEKTKAIQDGDTKVLEVMLASQAIALDSMFSSLAIRAKSNMGEYMHAAEKYMRLALKAQSQCRTTIETLAEMKNPQPFIQNNKAQYQQVNNKLEQNTRPIRAGAHAGENNFTNELMDEAHG